MTVLERTDHTPVDSDLPPLPPYLTRRRGGPERRTIILPDISRVETSIKIYDRQNNWITTIYQWMNRVVGEGIFDPQSKWWTAHICTRAYRNWLQTYETKDGIPPHISFGGAIEAGERDITFKDRWTDYARETFV